MAIWVMHQTIDLTNFPAIDSPGSPGSFVCDGVTYNYMYVSSSTNALTFLTNIPGDALIPYTGGVWSDEKYREVNFTGNVPSNYAAWLAVNADPKLNSPSLTVSGSSLGITFNDANAEIIDIYANGVLKTTITRNA